MAINDPIGDLLTRIRNGQLRGLAKVATPASVCWRWTLRSRRDTSAGLSNTHQPVTCFCTDLSVSRIALVSSA